MAALFTDTQNRVGIWLEVREGGISAYYTSVGVRVRVRLWIRIRAWVRPDAWLPMPTEQPGFMVVELTVSMLTFLDGWAAAIPRGSRLLTAASHSLWLADTIPVGHSLRPF